MTYRTASLLAGAAFLAAAGSASAGELKPGVVEIVDLGAHNAVVFYRDEPGGYHLFTGIQNSPEGSGSRTETLLAKGQRIVFSAPSVDGGEAQYFVVARDGDRVVVEQPGTN